MFKTRDSGNEKFHYIVHSSWKPPMENCSEEKSSMKTPVGSKATPALDPTVVNKVNASIFMTIKGMTAQNTEETFKNKLQEYLKEEHKNLVTDVKKAKKRKDLIILYCTDWESSNTIASSYTSKFMNHEVSFSLFSKTNPDAMQS